MGSSKKKASFRIDDLLQHSAEVDGHSLITRHMFSPATITATKAMDQMASSTMQSSKHRSAFPMSAAAAATPTTTASAPSFQRMVKHMLETPRDGQHTASSLSSKPPTSVSNQPMSALYPEMSPHKPMPLYAPPQQQRQPSSSLLDMTKQPNYCFPMPLPMTPPFSHAATAYLEHYANTFHKGQLSVYVFRWQWWWWWIMGGVCDSGGCVSIKDVIDDRIFGKGHTDCWRQ